MIDYKSFFPQISNSNAGITSPKTWDYNCIAWAAHCNDLWWWPGTDEGHYWPEGLPRVATVDNFANAFGQLGYSRCADGSLETGLSKVALYVDANDKPTHMARQLDDGRWTSKLGPDHDIWHEAPEILDGPAYGQAAHYFSRPK